PDLPILISADPDLIAGTAWAGISPGKRPVIQDSSALRFEAIKLHDKVARKPEARPRRGAPGTDAAVPGIFQQYDLHRNRRSPHAGKCEPVQPNRRAFD